MKGKKLPFCALNYSPVTFLLRLMYIKFQTRFEGTKLSAQSKRYFLYFQYSKAKRMFFRSSAIESFFITSLELMLEQKSSKGIHHRLLRRHEIQKGLKFYDVLCCDFISFMLMSSISPQAFHPLQHSSRFLRENFLKSNVLFFSRKISSLRRSVHRKIAQELKVL